MKYICPLITVSDMEKAKNFYQNILKQEIKYDFGENVTFHGDFAIHLKTHYEKLIDNKEIITRNNSFELYFEHDNLDEIVKKLKENDIEFVHEMREQPWRQKVVRFYDLDGNIIEVGESLEHLSYRLSRENLSLEEISKTTLMPVEFVKKSIEKFKLKKRQQ